ncbi:WD40-repeat-containing domain protein [Chytriomyces sp. MP71]|nr:WD40-repeat-containing domain protein [Chytriomyces sp. MP71]
MTATSVLSATSDGSVVSVCESERVRLFNADPFAEKLRIGVKATLASALKRSNFAAWVDARDATVVCVYDDLKQRIVLRLAHASRVLKATLTDTRIIVVLLTAVNVYTFGPHPVLLYTFPTHTNDDAIMEVSSTYAANSSKAVLAFLGRSTGHVQFCILDTASIANNTFTPAIPVVDIIPAHSSDIKCIALDSTGCLLATASSNGTLIRVFDTRTRALVHEFRRGTVEVAIVYSMAFSRDSSMLVVGSDRGTVHVFVVGPSITELTPTSESRANASSPGIDLTRRVTSGAPLSSPATRIRPDPQTGGFNSAPPSIASTPHHPAHSHATRSSGGDASDASSASASNRGSSLGFLAPLNRYFKSQWSFAQCSVAPGVPFICFFGGMSDPDGRRLREGLLEASLSRRARKGGVDRDDKEDAPDGFLPYRSEGKGDEQEMRWSPPVVIQPASVLVLSRDGCYYKFALDLRKGGDCVLERFYRLNGGGDGFAERVGESGAAGVKFGMAEH